MDAALQCDRYNEEGLEAADVRRLFFATLALSAAQLIQAQTQVQVQKAQLSIPFGSVTGTLVLAGDMLVFVDETAPQSSFGVSRTDVVDLRSDGETTIVEVRQAIRDRTGDRNRLSFRMMQPGAAGLLPDWWKQRPLAASASGAASSSATSASSSTSPGSATVGLTLPVRHDHRIGSCNGRLIVGEDRINYESVSEVSHSREWLMRDIKEIKHKNPYHLEIDGFGQDSYNFELQGRSLDTDEYQKIVDRIAAARVKR